MPTVRRDGPYRYFFVSSDRDEPPHIHVESGDNLAKFWLSPVTLAYSYGYAGHEERELLRRVEEHREQFEREWHAFFSDD